MSEVPLKSRKGRNARLQSVEHVRTGPLHHYPEYSRTNYYPWSPFPPKAGPSKTRSSQEQGGNARPQARNLLSPCGRAWSVCRTSYGVHRWWELEEPKGPKGAHGINS